MKYTNILVLFGLGATLLTGCSTSSDGLDSIVGKWHKSCYLPDGNDQYRVIDLVFRADGTGHLKKVKYDDEDCTLNPSSNEFDLNYHVGAKTTGDDKKEAYELDVTGGTGDEAWSDYQMFRFKDNGNLLISGTSQTHNGDSKEQRGDHFSEKWAGYVRQ